MVLFATHTTRIAPHNSAMDLWNRMGRPRYICAPMVDASELPFRMLVRRYGAHLCYTPMVHAKQYLGLESYRSIVFTSAPEDRPLIAQICGNDPSVIVECANLMLKQYPVDAIDLNLGCPQRIAQRGFYGAFLMDDLQLVERIVKSMVREIPVPITCKIRVFEDREKTVEYAKMLQECGIQMIVVHGRTRKLVKGYFDPADLQIIKRIKQELRIPVFANGNVEFHEDLEKVIQESNADGVMAAEGLLSNPKLFSLDNHDFKTPGDACDLALEYLDLAVQYPTTIGIIRGHCLRIMYKLLWVHADIRTSIATAQTIDELKELIAGLRKVVDSVKDGDKVYLNRYSWYRRHREKIELLSIRNAEQEENLAEDLGTCELFS